MGNEKPKNPGFLHAKYRDLNSSHEVAIAARAAERRQIDFTLNPRDRVRIARQSAVNANPADRIQSYLDWINGRINPVDAEGHPDQQRRENNLSQLKASLHREHVTKPAEIPEAYFESIKRKHRNEGHGDIEIPEAYRRELSEIIVNDQKKSLDNWIDYLASDDAKYPDWLRYFAMRNVVRMGRYDKQRKSFTERTGGTTAPFPDLNREALVIVLEAFEQQAVGKSPKFGYDISDDTKKQFLEFLGKKNFAKLYALAVEEFKPIAEELLRITEGEWRTYPRGSDPKALAESIAPYGTGWCIRGESMAERYLVRDKNELQVFYSLDAEGKPTVPRVVTVVNEQGQLTEVRGVAPEENLDSHIGSVVEAKLKEFPDGEAYKKKSADMQQLTAIDKKVKEKTDLARDDLVFLYEIDAPIEGFGYQTDPRIIELRKTRNPEADMPLVFDCTPEQIARTPADITKQMKAYVGELTPGIFEKLQSVGHIYTAFPEKKIRKEELELPGLTGEQWIIELEGLGIQISKDARHMLNSPDFANRAVKRGVIDKLLGRKDVHSPEKETASLIRLTVADLGFPNGATTKDIYSKAEELGLELCPAEVGPALRKKYTNQPLGEYLFIGMKQISGSGGSPDVFELRRRGGGLWLGGRLVCPGNSWLPVDEFVFRLPAGGAGFRKFWNLKMLGFFLDS